MTQNHTTKKLIFPLQVLFEDDHLAVIHKPAGIIVSGNKWKTIARALPDNLRPSQQPDACAPQPAHRLDFPTTGALLIGKTTSCIRTLNQMFEAKEIHKTYLAIAIGKMKPEGNIHTPIDDKPSETDYRVIQSSHSERFGALNLVKLYPRTGRRHQLRQHLASIGHPILGDKEYGIESLILNGKGLYLHAHRLEFVHPFTKEQLNIEDELPKKFKKIFP